MLCVRSLFVMYVAKLIYIFDSTKMHLEDRLWSSKGARLVMLSSSIARLFLAYSSDETLIQHHSFAHSVFIPSYVKMFS